MKLFNNLKNFRFIKSEIERTEEALPISWRLERIHSS